MLILHISRSFLDQPRREPASPAERRAVGVLARDGALPLQRIAVASGSGGDRSSVLPGEGMAGALRGLPPGPDSSVVVATHGELDEDALAQVLTTPTGYVSLVASRKRAGTIVETLRRRGVPADHLDRLTAPAGLDIGAVTPEEIAVSILAEVIHARHRRKTEPVEIGGFAPAC